MSFLCEMKRYGEATTKYVSEIVLLRGSGCTWHRCSYCDYCLDENVNIMENYKLNREVLKNVTGKHDKIQIVCSGSFAELDMFTLAEIKRVCTEVNMKEIVFEGHWQHRHLIPFMRDMFRDFVLKFNVGTETFDIPFREVNMNKGMGMASPTDIREHFERTNIMFGIKGQTWDMFVTDIKIGLKLFEYVSVNIFTPNTTVVERDDELIERFYNSELYQELKNHERCIVIDDLSPDKEDGFDGVGSEVKC